MERKGFYAEETLEEMLFDHKISCLDFIMHHSQERIDEYKEYCRRKGVPEDETSASSFFDYRLMKEEKAHTEEYD